MGFFFCSNQQLPSVTTIKLLKKDICWKLPILVTKCQPLKNKSFLSNDFSGCVSAAMAATEGEAARWMPNLTATPATVYGEESVLRRPRVKAARVALMASCDVIPVLKTFAWKLSPVSAFK